MTTKGNLERVGGRRQGSRGEMGGVEEGGGVDSREEEEAGRTKKGGDRRGLGRRRRRRNLRTEEGGVLKREGGRGEGLKEGVRGKRREDRK